ncbi:AraC family transcriptional regulator [Aurantimonas sp. Leaf443]|uniref:helix-turn-helix domain-containing protein n=1 Tax=Aurantimonas sp. Leaf443 TaxID=1736378 RepID=UPI0006FAA63A|nr:AraC family transcriptional regulator [Aurantimonas sp. Leaf443]KQT84093.1 hypothetical protein ASG48_12055 [Aurantimonas sp. Leaf443]
MSEENGTFGLRASLHMFSLKAGRADDTEALNEIGFLPVQFRPQGRAGLDLSIEGLHSRKVNLWRTRSTSGFKSRPKAEIDVLSVRLLLKGRMTRIDGGREFVAETGHGIALPFEAMNVATMSPAFDALSCSIPQRHLRAAFETLEGRPAPVRLAFEPVVAFDTRAVRAFAATLRSVHRRLSRSPEGADLFYPLLEELMLHQFLSSWPMHAHAQPDAAGPAHSRVVRRARDYMEAHLATPMTVAEIAAAAGVSVRVLQLTFRKEIDRTPIQYILERRLDLVRDELARAGPDTRISQVSTRWGFTSASDFSARYKARFGCTPTQTLAQALNRHNSH